LEREIQTLRGEIEKMITFQIKRYCEKCKKETKTYLKIFIMENYTHKILQVRTIDICKECAIKEFPDFKNRKRTGLQKKEKLRK